MDFDDESLAANAGLLLTATMAARLHLDFVRLAWPRATARIVGANLGERVDAPPIASTFARCHRARAASGAVLRWSAGHQGYGWTFRRALGVSL